MAEKGNNYYYDGGYIKPDLVTTEAERSAKLIMKKSEDPKDNAEMTGSQLRRFYGDVKALEMRYNNSSDKKSTFSEILPMIKLMKAKSIYSWKRKVVTATFKNWIGDNVDQIKDEDDFKAFLLYFEAVVGFCYGNGLKD